MSSSIALSPRTARLFNAAPRSHCRIALVAMIAAGWALARSPLPARASGKPREAEVPTSAPAAPTPPGIGLVDAEHWKLVWQDEFDGATLDETKWSHRFLGPRESSMISKDCISLDGQGLLHVWVKEKDGVLQNGMIGTQKKFAAKFGIMAARIQFPRPQGQHGSLWMQPATRVKGAEEATTGGAEIDVVEWFGAWRKDTGIASNVYWGGDNGKKNRRGQIADVRHLLGPGELPCDDFHVYSVEWSPAGYVFRMDGQETFRVTEGISYQPQYLILSLLTADWEAERLDRSLLPNSMAVDWVRVWQKTDYTEEPATGE